MAKPRAPRGWKDSWRPGELAYFEYHCEESHESSDAEIWYRSRQPVLVLRVVEPGGYRTFRERAYWGMPRLYKVRFMDGLEWDVFEDELVTSERYYDPAFEPGERPQESEQGLEMAASKQDEENEDPRVVAYIKKALFEDRVKIQYRGKGAEILVDEEVFAKFGSGSAARRWLKKMRSI